LKTPRSPATAAAAPSHDTRPHPPWPVIEERRDLAALLVDVRGCRRCEIHLPLGPRPVLQADPRARLLIASQAPGRRVHDSGIPFQDASGARLRDWMGVDAAVFYDPSRCAILPMGFCYPGRGTSGDRAPRPECAPSWRAALVARLPRVALTLVVGRYAIAHHLAGRARPTLTETVADWRAYGPSIIPLPHPSPRNNPWLRANPWFEREVVPALRQRLAAILGGRDCTGDESPGRAGPGRANSPTCPDSTSAPAPPPTRPR